MTGPSIVLDPSRYLARRDLASIALADRVFAPHYAEPVTYRVAAPAQLLDAPSAGADVAANLELGMDFNVLDLSSGWAWGQLGSDGAVGYVRADALTHP